MRLRAFYDNNVFLLYAKVRSIKNFFNGSFEGQLISECLLGVKDFPKKQRNIWQISALKSKKWSNQQGKSTF